MASARVHFSTYHGTSHGYGLYRFNRLDNLVVRVREVAGSNPGRVKNGTSASLAWRSALKGKTGFSSLIHSWRWIPSGMRRRE